MTDPREAIHEELSAMFNPNNMVRFTSISQEAAKAEDVEALMLPEDERGRLPFTRADYVIKEDPRRVQWEREVRKFLSKIPRDGRGNKVNAPMVFEWATGVKIADLMVKEGTVDHDGRGGGRWGSANVHLRHINWVLKEYFGTPYKTTILGVHVGKAYRVRPWFDVKKKKPACLTLLPEWDEGTLGP